MNQFTHLYMIYLESTIRQTDFIIFDDNNIFSKKLTKIEKLNIIDGQIYKKLQNQQKPLIKDWEWIYVSSFSYYSNKTNQAFIYIFDLQRRTELNKGKNQKKKKKKVG